MCEAMALENKTRPVGSGEEQPDRVVLTLVHNSMCPQIKVGMPPNWMLHSRTAYAESRNAILCVSWCIKILDTAAVLSDQVVVARNRMSSIAETVSSDGEHCFVKTCPFRSRKCVLCLNHQQKTFLCKRHRYKGCCRCHLPGRYQQDAAFRSQSSFDELVEVFLVETILLIRHLFSRSVGSLQIFSLPHIHRLSGLHTHRPSHRPQAYTDKSNQTPAKTNY